MAIIHRTELTPSKLELLAGWLPSRPWWRGGTATLERVGGFRLDDPDGEVGLEFMVVAHGPHAYFVPLAYRGAPLEGADHALIGTSEHGVLGRRWIYDGVHDPVLVGRLAALLGGEAVPQHQSLSDTPDPTVEVRPVPAPLPTAGFTVADAQAATLLEQGTTTIEVIRILDAPDIGQVVVKWTRPDGTAERGVALRVRDGAAG
ncbi:hypothetical protein GCM10027589_54850 [Actinocorallia lasiicapitis]